MKTRASPRRCLKPTEDCNDVAEECNRETLSQYAGPWAKIKRVELRIRNTPLGFPSAGSQTSFAGLHATRWQAYTVGPTKHQVKHSATLHVSTRSEPFPSFVARHSFTCAVQTFFDPDRHATLDRPRGNIHSPTAFVGSASRQGFYEIASEDPI